MINRFEWVSRHNIKLNSIDYQSPLSVGNGEIAYGFDATGMQTLYLPYAKANTPLCTMSQWGWHRINKYTEKDLVWTEYQQGDRVVSYASEPQKGNENVYHWLRENPHRFNLARIGLLFKGETIEAEQIQAIEQELMLYKGIAKSVFKINNKICNVLTFCDPNTDTLAFHIESELLKSQELSLIIAFPYGHHTITGSDFDKVHAHHTELIPKGSGNLCFHRVMDATEYFMNIQASVPLSIKLGKQHEYEFVINQSEVDLTVHFSREENSLVYSYQRLKSRTQSWWEKFWNKGAAIDFSKAKDSRAQELERRIVLSLYQSAIHGSGSMPPQETGLACNSWYGKFHLEMHLLHSLYLPFWNRGDLLGRSLKWYKEHLDKAYANAWRNGYLGARWPKMIDDEGNESPSWIATLLIWQQAHILYMLESLYQVTQDKTLLKEYEELVIATADFMCDFVSYNEESECYDLLGPIIPVQEEHKPMDTVNPAFEVAYWRFGLELAVGWIDRIRHSDKVKDKKEKWKTVAERMAPIPRHQGLYIAHENCEDTFKKYNRDHPSMLMAYGLIPNSLIEADIMKQTYQKVLKEWDFHTLWGWDFAMMAMTAVRLNEPEWAVEALLLDTPKNTYVKNGHNYQLLREDLPVYLPGNGSLLLAVGMMATGYGEQQEQCIGFPRNGQWDDIEVDGIFPLPY
jgi:hypothetical protein